MEFFPKRESNPFLINKREGMQMKMIYGVKDRPKPAQLILFSLQQLLAILAATILVPIITSSK